MMAVDFSGRMRRVLAACSLALLAACGGGGGGDSSGSGPVATPAVFSARFSPERLEASSIEDHGTSVPYLATLSYTGNDVLWIGLDYDDSVIVTDDGTVSGDTVAGTLQLRGDLPAGVYETTVSVLACLDAQCATQARGSPAKVPLRFTVLPNVQVQRMVRLERTGREAGPTATLPVTAPAAAGALSMLRTRNGSDGIEMRFDGQNITVVTQKIPAGTYIAEAVLRGSADPRYERSVTVEYVVQPPPGGEQALAVTPASLDLTLAVGQRHVQQFQVTRPTWTDDWTPPRLCRDSGFATFRDLGNDTFELTVESAHLPVGSNVLEIICFDAGPWGGSATLSVELSVTWAFAVSGSTTFDLNAGSTLASLDVSLPVVTGDGVPARWSAVSGSPQLQLLRNTGITGTDPLAVRLRPDLGSLQMDAYALPVELRIDRADTIPNVVTLMVRDQIVRLEQTQAVLVGTSGRLYVDGFLPGLAPPFLDVLQVQGATLRQAQVLSDRRIEGDVLALDVDGAVPGTPIVVRSTAPLAPTSVQLAVEAPTRVPRGHLVLPFGAYRPGHHAPGSDSFYFAGADTVHRWSYAGGGWALTQTALPGLIDVALRPDGLRLHASSGGGAVHALDPTTLAPLSNGNLVADGRGAPPAFDPAVPADQSALMHMADGRALASLIDLDSNGQRARPFAEWVEGQRNTLRLPELTASPRDRSAGSCCFGGLPVDKGVGLVRSADGRHAIGNQTGVATELYDVDQRTWLRGPALPPGTHVVALADGGQRLLRSDGVLVDGSSELGSLATRVPAGHVAAGYGLAPDGRSALVYAYRPVLEAGVERARDAAVHVFDLSNLAATGTAAAPLRASLDLDDAVGCLGVLASGETCSHRAAIQVTPGPGSIFVVGPRGVAALPWPADMAPARKGPRPAKALRTGSGANLNAR